MTRTLSIQVKFDVLTSKLLNLDVERMTTLAKEWGGVPDSLLYFVGQHLTDSQIELIYTRSASKAIQRCDETLSSILCNTLPDDAPSQFYFCGPRNDTNPVLRRLLLGVSVPTRTLCRILGEALQKQTHVVKREFFRGMCQHDSTHQAARHIYESWFHSNLSAGKSIECHWVQGLDGVSTVTGGSLIDTDWGAVKVANPPFYWVAPKNFYGVDSALIFAKEIYVFQVSIKVGTRNTSLMKGLETLRAYLPTTLNKLPWCAWRMVFVGSNDCAIESVANNWVGKLVATDNTNVTIGWSKVDPVMKDVTYKVLAFGSFIRDALTCSKVFRDESDPDVEASDEALIGAMSR